MLRSFKTIGIVILVSAFIGAFFGVILGALAESYLLWIAVSTVIGGALGVGFAYGFLPES